MKFHDNNAVKLGSATIGTRRCECGMWIERDEKEIEKRNGAESVSLRHLKWMNCHG